MNLTRDLQQNPSSPFDESLDPEGGDNFLTCEVEKITFRNSDNGWTVLKVRSLEDMSLITVTGTLPVINEGEFLQLVGTWSTHTTFGRQFKTQRAVYIRPNTRASILRYLSSGIIQGIGEKTAERIVNYFGLDTFKVLDENPGCLLQVPKIGKKKVAEIIDSWKQQKALSDIMMFLSHHGISLVFSQRILSHYGERTMEVISANPYQLAVDISGIGFLKADAIAQSIGIAPDSPERIRAALIYQMQQSEEKGHCFQTVPQLKEQLGTFLGLSESTLQNSLATQLALLEDTGSLLSEEILLNEQETKVFWRPELLAAECDIARKISDYVKLTVDADPSRIDQWISRYNSVTSSPLSKPQMDAVKLAASSRFFILTGGPGVGKTTTANAIIRLFRAMGKSVLLAAPTGRAAQRLSEVSAEKAVTIHRLLEWQPAQGGFARDEHNNLKADVIICDECSMLDARLASSLLLACPQYGQIIFIGDVDQLPSVGPGNVLRDLISSEKVPYTRLKEIFRQAATSSIIQYSHSINEGMTPNFETQNISDCLFIDADSSHDIRAVMSKLLVEVLPSKYQFDPLRDVQILVPMNRGDLGTHALNEELQDLLNPDKNEHHRDTTKSDQKREIRPGDKVIQTVNNYDLQVFNGDIGYVTATHVDGGKTKITFGDGRCVTYDREQLIDLKLAYAITIHKSQGSEFPVVILPISMQHYVMLQRNLVYTGLTRAKKLAIFIGSKKALSFAVKNNQSFSRQTNLSKRLTGDFL